MVNIKECDMDKLLPPQKIRILSDAPELVEVQLNELCVDYAPIVWNVGPVGDRIVVTVVLLHESEIRKGQLAQVGMPANMMRRN